MRSDGKDRSPATNRVIVHDEEPLDYRLGKLEGALEMLRLRVEALESQPTPAPIPDYATHTPVEAVAWRILDEAFDAMGPATPEPCNQPVGEPCLWCKGIHDSATCKFAPKPRNQPVSAECLQDLRTLAFAPIGRMDPCWTCRMMDGDAAAILRALGETP